MTAANQKIRRLPGFRFEAVAPAREDVLPRMDVALFVGFASAGPIGIPVAVESADQFKTIFGDDLSLVWNPKKGRNVAAYLAPTVRAFFRNGGRRCWILRAARLEADREKPLNRACYNFFPLAGLISVDFDDFSSGGCQPVLTRARAKGSWSDDWLVGTSVLFEALKISDFVVTPDSVQGVLEIAAGASISAGDLLKVSIDDESAALFLSLDEIKEESADDVSPPKAIPAFGKRRFEFFSKRFVWSEKPSPAVEPGKTYQVEVKLWSGRSAAQAVAATDDFSSKLSADFKILDQTNAEEIDKCTLLLENPSLFQVPLAGQILTCNLMSELLVLQVESVRTGGRNTEVEILCRVVRLHRHGQVSKKSAQGERLTFELRINQDKKSYFKLSGLGFNNGHPRYWGDLPTDEEFHRMDESAEVKAPSWTRTGDGVNFPLAGFAPLGKFCLPIFSSMPEIYTGALRQPGTKLQRDGLEVFDEDLFLDPKLKNTTTSNLLNEGEFIRYLSSRPRPLWGIHAALVPETVAKIAVESSPFAPAYANYSLDECTIISVPDAAHRGWFQTTEEAEILSPPVFSPPVRPEWWHFDDCRDPHPQKVSAPLWGNFLDCALRVVPPPVDLRVEEPGVRAGKFSLAWTFAQTAEKLEFVLQESSTPKFEFFEEIYRGRERRFEISGRSAGVYYYRVRVEIGGQFSDWSRGLAARIPAAENWVVNEEFVPATMLAVHRALLRMCAARGDLFAVLNFPEHYGSAESFAHVATLRATKGETAENADVAPFSADETRALSFGAVYHPWILTREEEIQNLQTIPPDGAVCGVMAHRAATRGAWIAPANEIFRGVLGLNREIRRSEFLDFQDNSINLVRQEPRGFLALDADTLSEEFDLRAINVRRLLSLLCRLALRHGAEYVFEPNDARFRRLVERGFSALLGEMFSRGAFAGATAAASFQVVVGETVNDQRSVDAGRFIVELRVAPSLPLKFVTVRLVQAGARSNVTEVF